MKKLIALGIGGIAAVLFYMWANPSSPLNEALGLAPPSQERSDAADAQEQTEFNSELAQDARTACRQKLGIKEQVMTGMDVAKLGYGSQKGAAFTRCVADAMYPGRN